MLFTRLMPLVWLAAACGPRDHPALRPWAAQPLAGAPWYEQSRSVDLTGDGVADSVVLRAYGSHAESLDVALSIFVGPEEAFRETWNSSYELKDPPWDSTPAPGVIDSFIRSQFTATLQGVTASPLDQSIFVRPAVLPPGRPWEDDPVQKIASSFQWESAGLDFSQVPPDSVRAVMERVDRIPYDTAEILRIAIDIRQNTRLIALLAYGYETVLELAWSQRARRFYVLSACC